MARPAPETSSSIFSDDRRLPDDTVFYSLYPDPFLLSSPSSSSSPESLQTLHLEILRFISPFTVDYVWHHDAFTLSVSHSPPLPHLRGALRFGDCLDDEWFAVFLLFQISLRFPSLSISVRDSDGEFLLIEAAFHLPRWLDPDNSGDRIFLRNGHLHIIPPKKLPNPNLIHSLRVLIDCEEETRASTAVQLALRRRISEYPEKARRSVHRVRVTVPVAVAAVLREEPCLVSLAVEGFYDRDIDTMKYAAKMERFLGEGSGKEMVCVAVKMSRAMYAQLMQQKFHAPKGYPMPRREDDAAAYLEAELGMKIACGFEMMYWQRKKVGEEGKGKGSGWDKYKESLEKSGYFDGLLPGSKEYNTLMEKAEEYYRNTALFSKTSEMMSAPVRRIDEILALPHSADDFRRQDVPPSDDDSWLYGGEDELNAALKERQKELDLYNMKCEMKQKSKEARDGDPLTSTDLDDFDLGSMAKAMRSFVDKVSSYKGAEIPENRNLDDVDLDVDRFLKDMESVMKRHGPEDNGSDVDIEEASSSDMDFDESEDGCDEDNEDGEDTFMQTYSDALNEQLKKTTLKRSFIHANEQSSKMNEGTSNAAEVIDEEFTPVDVDVNLVKNLLESFSSQQGLPGPTSNLLGLMGLQLPQDAKKSK